MAACSAAQWQRNRLAFAPPVFASRCARFRGIAAQAKNAFCTALRMAARAAVKLTPPCRVAGVGRAQRAVAAQLDRAALGEAAGGHDDLVRVAGLVGRFGGDDAVDGAAVLDAGAEALQRRRTAGVKTGDDVVVVVGIARHRAHAGQLKQALRIDGGLERFAHNAGRVVEAEEGIAQGCPACSRDPPRCRGP